MAELGAELNGTDREATEKEFADVFAWLASLANIMGIDLEKAALSKYNNKCPKCSSEKIIKRGFAYTDVAQYQRFKCQDCLCWFRGRENLKKKAK